MDETSGVFPAMRVVNWVARQLEYEEKIYHLNVESEVELALDEVNKGLICWLFKSWKYTREDVLKAARGGHGGSLSLVFKTMGIARIDFDFEESRGHLLRLKALAFSCRDHGTMSLSLADFSRLEQGRAHAAQEVRNQKGIT